MIYYVQNVKDKKYLKIIESYRVPGSNKTKVRTIVNYGELSKLKDLYDDPIEHFRVEAEKYIAENINKKIKIASTSLDSFARNDFANSISIDDNSKYIGTVFLSYIYHTLGLKDLFDELSSKYKVEYSLNDVFKFLVFSRCLFSKSKAFSHNYYIDKLGEKYNLSLNSLYRANKIINKHKKEIIETITRNINKLYKYDFRISHYDITNFYIYCDAIDNEEIKKLAKKGYDKDNTGNPIVQLAMIIDKKGMPFHYKVFPGNRNDVSTVKDFVNELSNMYNLKRSIIVADAGARSTENILSIKVSGNGYILKYPIKKMSSDLKSTFENIVYPIMKEEILKNELEYMYFPITLDSVKEFEKDGKKHKITIREKYIFQYSDKFSKKEKHKITKDVERATKILNLKNKDKSIMKEKYKDILKKENIVIDPTTGEMISNLKVIETLELDSEYEEKLKKYAGFSILVTDQYTLKNEEIIKAYREQYAIEHIFKICKSDLLQRPIHTSLDVSMSSHFSVCYTSLVILKILKELTNNKYSIFKMKQSLSSVKYILKEANYYELNGYDQILIDIEKAIFKSPKILTKARSSQIRNIYSISKKI